MKKKLIIFIVFLSTILLISFTTIKANAASASFRVYPSSSDNVYFYLSPYSLPNNYTLFIDNEGNQISCSIDPNDSSQYFLNGNSSYIFKKSYLYVVEFQNGVNHYNFYVLDFSYPLNTSTMACTYVFTISFSSSTITYIDSYSQCIQFMLSNNPALNTQDIINVFYLRFRSTPYAIYGSTAYSNGHGVGYNEGYSTGYSTGYEDGQEGKTALNKVWDLLSGIFGVIGSIMSIELFPYVPLGLFFFVPLFFAGVGFIIWIWRRN